MREVLPCGGHGWHAWGRQLVNCRGALGRVEKLRQGRTEERESTL